MHIRFFVRSVRGVFSRYQPFSSTRRSFRVRWVRVRGVSPHMVYHRNGSSFLLNAMRSDDCKWSHKCIYYTRTILWKTLSYTSVLSSLKINSSQWQRAQPTNLIITHIREWAACKIQRKSSQASTRREPILAGKKSARGPRERERESARQRAAWRTRRYALHRIHTALRRAKSARACREARASERVHRAKGLRAGARRRSRTVPIPAQ